ncbi:MarR family winged helix-turn-helix transcriptional regulator [Dactylosporangium sp. NBC_01737]|uniref:MarR family winged helix-turn-helix transcriptional regulator n=1 Tax=Dactylosporangium sp. NBC_01737 TaxID=2975959 RepID=UPI002E100D23|nr:MarR family winged helix-turn-helix transcriptional regulator [Dactylosporangium sp. NBC_01737]
MEERPDASTGYLLARLGAESRRRWARMLAEHQLAPHHLAVLMSLGHVGPVHQQRVSALIGVDPRNTVAVVDLLQRRGLVERAVDPGDRRRNTVTLTADGVDLLTRLREQVDAVEDVLLGGLPGHERELLHGLLSRLADTLP